jgi:hypothetical protein
VWENWERVVVYFVGKFLILKWLDSEKKWEGVYELHKRNITCIKIWSEQDTIFSGEEGFEPEIHVTDAKSLEKRLVIKTFHEGGIFKLEVCKQV